MAEVVKVPEAPEVGGVKVTVTPGTGLPIGRSLRPVVGEGRATVVFWPVPETRLMVSPVVLAVLVSEKFTEVAPVAEATTL